MKDRIIELGKGDIFIAAGRMADTLNPVLDLYQGEPGEIGREHPTYKNYVPIHPDNEEEVR